MKSRKQKYKTLKKNINKKAEIDMLLKVALWIIFFAIVLGTIFFLAKVIKI